MRLEVENLSMLAKEKVWMLSYMACRRLRARPAEARAPKVPPPMPAARPMRAMITMTPPMM